MNEHIGKKISARLDELKKTQGWLAEQMDVSDNAVSKWIKTGKISRENIPKLAHVLCVTIGELLAESEPPVRRSASEGRLERLDPKEALLIELFRESSVSTQNLTILQLEVHVYPQRAKSALLQFSNKTEDGLQ